MKLDTIDNTFEASLTGSIEKFQLKVTSRAFKLLSKDVYSDPIQAVVRELGTNAMDSHTAAGKGDQPFTYHVPNLLEPWFSVQDHGLGLDADGLRIFTTYFESNKTQDDAQTGALGLGSKSPFAYATSFTVDAIKDGIKRSLVCFLTEDSSPDWSVIATVETDEENGVTVTVPVREEDFEKFEKRIFRQAMFFSVEPKIMGNLTDYKRDEIILLGTSWRIVKSHDSSPLLVMGGVPYVIPLDLLRTSKLYRLRHQLIIEAPIGAVDFSINRENLQLTEKTLTWLANRVKEIETELKEVTKQLATDGFFLQLSLLFRDRLSERDLGITKKLVEDRIKETGTRDVEYKEKYSECCWIHYRKCLNKRSGALMSFISGITEGLSTIKIFTFSGTRLPTGAKERIEGYMLDNSAPLAESYIFHESTLTFLQTFFPTQGLAVAARLEDLPYVKPYGQTKKAERSYTVCSSDKTEEAVGLPSTPKYFIVLTQLNKDHSLSNVLNHLRRIKSLDELSDLELPDRLIVLSSKAEVPPLIKAGKKNIRDHLNEIQDILITQLAKKYVYHQTHNHLRIRERTFFRGVVALNKVPKGSEFAELFSYEDKDDAIGSVAQLFYCFADLFLRLKGEVLRDLSYFGIPSWFRLMICADSCNSTSEEKERQAALLLVFETLVLPKMSGYSNKAGEN